MDMQEPGTGNALRDVLEATDLVSDKAKDRLLRIQRDTLRMLTDSTAASIYAARIGYEDAPYLLAMVRVLLEEREKVPAP